MIRKALHIICGKCGAYNDELKFKIALDGHDDGEKLSPAVFVSRTL